MEETDAEKMKLKYASAYTDNAEIDNNLKYSIDQDRQIEARKFIEIVEGRLEEIIANVWCQVPEEYCDKLLGGIILTGGGSNMKDIEKAFQNYTHIDKIRIAKFVTQTITSTLSDINAQRVTSTALARSSTPTATSLPHRSSNRRRPTLSAAPVRLSRHRLVSFARSTRFVVPTRRLAARRMRKTVSPVRRRKLRSVSVSASRRKTPSGTRCSKV